MLRAAGSKFTAYIKRGEKGLSAHIHQFPSNARAFTRPPPEVNPDFVAHGRFSSH